MAKRMLIDAVHPEETRVVIVDDKQILDFDFISAGKKQTKGNIYLAKITRVEPSLQAAFVEYGGGKQGFLPFSEIHADYYQIPAADRKRLLEEAAREAAEEEEAENAAHGTSDETPQEAASQEAGEEPFATTADESPVAGAMPLFQDVLPEEAPVPAAIPFLQESPALEITIDNFFPEAPSDAPAEAVASEGETAYVPATISENTPTETTSEAANEAVETIASEEEDAQQQRKKRSFFKRYKIQEVIRRGQVVLVQVIKEERGNKGASLTTYLSLAGRYCVLMPNSPKDGGISRKIASPEDRKRLKAISTELRLAEGMSVIIRTAGMDRPRAEIKRDFDYLVKLWNQIRDVTLQSTAPAQIYEESDVIKRAIRDQYSNEMDEVIVQGEEGYRTAHDFMKLLMPSHTSKIKLHKDSTPLLYAYDIEDQLMSMHDPVVKLKSGGYIVINTTEALIAIDVNSGRSTAERNIEETAVKTNIEAATEVGRQLRLRDLAGLVVIDFIDMLDSRNRRAVEKTLKDVLKADRAKIQLGRISPFGLLEMSRQRLRPSISETSMMQCPHCEGRGVIRSNESMSIQIIRAIEKEASSAQWGTLRVIAPQATALHLLNHKRDILRAMEERYGVTVQILIDTELTTSEFNMEKMRKANPEKKQRYERDRNRSVSSNSVEMSESSDTEAEPVENAEKPARSEDGTRPRRGRRGGKNRRGGRDRDDRAPRTETTDDQAATTVSDNNDDAPQDGEANSNEANSNNDAASNDTQRPRRNRGNRGGRGRREWVDRSGEPPVPFDGQQSESSNVVAFEQHSSEPSAPLPAFTQRSAVEQPAANVVNIHGSTPTDPNANPKKGWWQRMINLDD